MQSLWELANPHLRELAVYEPGKPIEETARELGADAELEGVRDILERGNGAQRQRKVYEANHDFHELVRDLVEASGG